MREQAFLDYAALREWQAEIISYEKQQDGYFLQTSRGARMLYIAPKSEEAETALHMSKHLLSHGFPFAPRLIQNRYGEYYTKAFNGYYYLTDALGGTEPFYEHEGACIEAAACLGAFHKASHGFYGKNLPSLTFAGEKIARRLLQLRCFACLDRETEQNMSYLFQSTATALMSFNRQKEQKLKKLYRKRGGLNLGGQIQFLRCQQDKYFLADIHSCKSGGGIIDLSELLLIIAEKENFSAHNSLQALKAYNRENRLEKEEMDLLFSALLLPVKAIKVLNTYLRSESDFDTMYASFHVACAKEKEKNRWVKRLLM